MTLFNDLPPIDAQKFQADVGQIADSEAYFDAYERARQDMEGE